MKKYQRMLKLKMIKKSFDSLQFEYFDVHDTYKVFLKGKLIYSTLAHRNVQDIIDEIRIKREKSMWMYFK